MLIPDHMRETVISLDHLNQRSLAEIIAPASPRSPMVIAKEDPYQITYLEVAIEVDCFMRFHRGHLWEDVYYHAILENNDILKNIRRKKRDAHRRAYEIKGAQTEKAKQAAIRKVENEKRAKENRNYLSARFQQGIDCADEAFAGGRDPISASVKTVTCLLKKLKEPVAEMYNNGDNAQCGAISAPTSGYSPSCKWSDL